MVEQRTPNPQAAGSIPVSPANPLSILEFSLIGFIKKQYQDFADELSRVDWPAQDKVFSSAQTVVVTSVLVGIFLWLIDWIMSYGFGQLIPKN